MSIILKESNFINLDLRSLKKREEKILSRLSLTLSKPFTDVLKTRCHENICRFHWKTPAMKLFLVIFRARSTVKDY